MWVGSGGMQCPPMPGPGWNGMKPKGLVVAASMTSETSMPILWHSMDSSFTKAMLTCPTHPKETADIGA